MNKKNKITLLVFTILSVIALLVIKFSTTSPPTITLKEVEINEYKGENLTPLSQTPSFGIKGTQKINVDKYTLSVTGLVEQPLRLTYDEVLRKFTHYEKVVKLNCVTGWSAKLLFEGVLISDILKMANVKEGANTVIFHCEDGYTTSLPLQYIQDENILLAYKVNGITLPPEYGFPFRVVAEAKYGYKWAKWVVGIEVTDNPNYKGYWESRGFSNDGDIEHP